MGRLMNEDEIWGQVIGRKPCPDCQRPKPRRHPDYSPECTLNKPLWMVIPPEGAHLSCPIHPNGHHIYGPSVRF
jgi:hypothetical protein